MGNKQTNNIIEIAYGDEDLSIPNGLDTKNIKIRTDAFNYILEQIYDDVNIGNLRNNEFISLDSFLDLVRQVYINERTRITSYELQIAVLKNKIEDLQREIDKEKDKLSPSFSCVVCLEDFKPSKLKVLKCHPTHILCLECFEQIKKSNNIKCPLCRENIN